MMCEILLKKCKCLKLPRKQRHDFILRLRILLLGRPNPWHLLSEPYDHVCCMLLLPATCFHYNDGCKLSSLSRSFLLTLRSKKSQPTNHLKKLTNYSVRNVRGSTIMCPSLQSKSTTTSLEITSDKYSLQN